MGQLRQSDICALLDFVQGCYTTCELTSYEQFVQQLINALSRLIPATHITYNEMYPLKPESHNFVNTAELATPIAAGLWEQHMNEHPVMAHVLQTDDRRAMRISDFWSQRQLHDHGLYNDFYRLYDIEDALCITVPCRRPRVIGIGWHDGRRFCERERLIADLVRPHISQALRNAKLVIELQRERQLLRQGMESSTLSGAIGCNAEGRVQFSTTVARRQLVEYFGDSHNLDHFLPMELLRWVRYQRAQVQKDHAPPISEPLAIQKGNKRLTVRLMSDAGTNLLLLEEEFASPNMAEVAQLGLSPRESEVLGWVAQGKTNAEVAMILGMRLPTAKKHLEHIFQKLGVETRTSAVSVLLRTSARNDH
jgi:DNA-binding CsgD family transcriptional regulator